MSARTDRRPCPVQGCEQLIAPTMAMCRTHWYLLPLRFKRSVAENYRERPGSPEHVRAIAVAVAAVESLSHQEAQKAQRL